MKKLLNTNSAEEAIKYGFIQFPAHGEFSHRNGSGGKLYVLDSRGAGSNILLRKLIINELIEKSQEFPHFDTIGGVSKSGTTWGCWVALTQDLPFVNILPEARKSGLQRRIEGTVKDKNILLVDNWISTGTSLESAQEAVKAEGGMVVGYLVITNDSRQNYSLSSPLKSIWDVNKLLDTAKEIGLLSKELYNKIFNKH